MHFLARIYLLLPLLLAGMIASAQTTTIPVRAGEHADFTRLVIQIPDENTWRVTTDETTARLIVDGPVLQFDLSQTFSRIPRTRLRNVVAAAGNLELHLGCLCEVRAFEDIPGFLIIDILGVAHEPAPLPVITTRPPPRPETLLRPGAAQSADNSRAGLDLARSMRGQSPQDRAPISLTLLPFDPAVNRLSIPSAPDQSGQSATSAVSRAEITQELGRMVAASVAQGRLVPNQELPVAPGRPEADSPMAPHLDQAMAGHLAPLSTATPSDEQTAACSRLSRLDLTGWASESESGHSPHSLDGLYGEFDKIDPDKGLALIRSYLSLGFGAEARLSATLLDLPSPMANLVNAISYIVDLEVVPDTDALVGLSECGSEGALWAFLGDTTDAEKADFPFDALILAVDALPPHLRLHLGPAILQQLTHLGQNKPAMMIEAALDRVAAQHSDSLQLAKVARALSDAPPAHAEALENTLSPHTSDEALIFLLTRREASDDPVTTDLIELGKSRRLALRGDPQAVELTGLLARALARNGAFAEAFSLAQSWDTGMTPQDLATLNDDLFDRLTRHAGDGDFVERVFDLKPWEHHDLSPRQAAQIAQRLTELGFDPQARLMRQRERAVLPPRPAQSFTQSESGAEAASFEAESFVSSNRPDQEFNDIIRARQAQQVARSEQTPTTPAQRMVADPPPLDPVDAATAPQQLPDTTSQTQAVASSQRAAPRPEGTRPDASMQDGLLAETRDLLQQSAVLRERLEAMLSEGN